MLKINTTLFLIALCTVILEPDMQLFFTNFFLCHTFLLRMNQMHVVHPIFTLMLRALIQTIYRALLTSAVSGVGHRIQTLKKMHVVVSLGA